MKPKYRTSRWLDYMTHEGGRLHSWTIFDGANVRQCVVNAVQFAGKLETRNKRAKLMIDRICEAMND